MAELEPKEVHEKRIEEKKRRNIERAIAHGAGRIQNDPRMPHEKIEHRLTNNPPATDKAEE